VRGVEIHRARPGDVDRVVAASALFDDPATVEWTTRFLGREGHDLLLATIDGVDVGFVTGVETTHPDKGTEMFLYELSVTADYRRRGIGRSLVAALADLAAERGCYGMWVATEADNEAALATYGAAGAAPPEPCVTLTWTFNEPPVGA
jgi:ribosomal protein S18 acetylase RimI-like enzyme